MGQDVGCSGRQQTEKVRTRCAYAMLLKVEAVANEEAAVVAVGIPLVAQRDHSGDATARGHRGGGYLSTVSLPFAGLGLGVTQ